MGNLINTIPVYRPQTQQAAATTPVSVNNSCN